MRNYDDEEEEFDEEETSIDQELLEQENYYNLLQIQLEAKSQEQQLLRLAFEIAKKNIFWSFYSIEKKCQKVLICYDLLMAKMDQITNVDNKEVGDL